MASRRWSARPLEGKRQQMTKDGPEHTRSGPFSFARGSLPKRNEMNLDPAKSFGKGAESPRPEPSRARTPPMLDAFKDFLRNLSGGPIGGSAGEDDPLVAAAALLFHVGEADGTLTEAEGAKLRELLIREYRLDPWRAEQVRRAGREADAEAVDLFRFTHVLMRHWSAEERVRFVELLWEVVFADGEVHELEDNTIWRVAELLGVSGRDRMLAKREAQSKIRTPPAQTDKVQTQEHG